MRKLLLLLIIGIAGCQMPKENVDLLIKNATIYTVDKEFSLAEAFVVRNGKIIDLGTTKEMEKKYEAREEISMDGKYIYPGLHDAHAHFVGYGLTLNEVDLTGTSSVDEIIQRCKEFQVDHQSGWITGWGWDQNDWEYKSFPSREKLDEYFPDTPVFLTRIDGHAAWLNTRALELAGINAGIQVDGGEIRLKNGEPDGILIDNAIDLVRSKIPKPGREEVVKSILNAQENCFAVGLTSICDAGLSYQEVKLLDSLQQEGSLKMRLDVWLEPSGKNFDTFMAEGIYRTEHLRVGTLKLYADGALGSRGARMLEDYSDDPGNRGLFLTKPDQIMAYCRKAMEAGYQVATHCIGDEANREVLSIYSEILEEGNDQRWRIEHAQIIHPDDFSTYGTYHIVPSVQATHATSDMYWAEERLGKARMKGAYSYNTLLEQNGWIPMGSDFPVESINPLLGFYAATTRQDNQAYPEKGFIPEEKLSREEALKAMTIWAAKSSFEEEYRGSLEKGKVADFVVFDEDLMTMNALDIPGLKVHSTFLDGKRVYFAE